MHSFLLKGKVHSDKHLKDFYKAETTKEEKAPGFIPATEELLPLKRARTRGVWSAVTPHQNPSHHFSLPVHSGPISPFSLLSGLCQMNFTLTYNVLVSSHL